MSGPSLFDLSKNARYSDATRTISPTELAARANAIADRISAEGLAGARLCLPLDSGLDSLAALIAVMEHGIGAALMPRPPVGEALAAPAFCDAVLLPPALGKDEDDLEILRLKPEADGVPQGDAGGWRGHVWLSTSGSTGTPKWVLLSVEALRRSAHASASRLGLGPDDRVLTTVPIHHSYGLGAGLLSGLVAGASIRLVARGNPLTVFQAQKEFQPTAMFMVPSQVRSMLALGRKAGRSRVVVVAGDKLLPEEAEAFEADHGTLVGLYGSTETNAMTASSPDDPAALRHGTAGRPLDGVHLALDESAASEAAGEGVLPMRAVVVNGFAGYADPETGMLMAPAPEIWTPGDLVRLKEGPDGIPRVEVMGRTDHAVKRDGLLVHLGQIEGCLARAEGVAVTAVVPAGWSRRGVGLLAFCTLSRPGTLTDEAILAHCREALPARAVPDRVEIISEMPMLASGKVDRKHLAQMAERLVDTASSAG